MQAQSTRHESIGPLMLWSTYGETIEALAEKSEGAFELKL